jgi:hypothetical protein
MSRGNAWSQAYLTRARASDIFAVTSPAKDPGPTLGPNASPDPTPNATPDGSPATPDGSPATSKSPGHPEHQPRHPKFRHYRQIADPSSIDGPPTRCPGARQQHRCAIDAVPATSLGHRCGSGRAANDNGGPSMSLVGGRWCQAARAAALARSAMRPVLLECLKWLTRSDQVAGFHDYGIFRCYRGCRVTLDGLLP